MGFVCCLRCDVALCGLFWCDLFSVSVFRVVWFVLMVVCCGLWFAVCGMLIVFVVVVVFCSLCFVVCCSLCVVCCLRFDVDRCCLLWCVVDYLMSCGMCRCLFVCCSLLFADV